jgi:DNA-directed RNA polymerase subunit F
MLKERRLWLWLGVAATAVLVALLGYVFTRGPSTRSNVSTYIEAVNTSERELAPDLRRVDLVYRKFKLDPKALAEQQDDLVKAEQTIRRVRTKIAAVPAPEQAAELRRRLLRTIDLEAAFAHDLVEVAAALPRLASVNEKIPPASKRLSKSLKQAKKGSEQVAALTLYARQLRDVADEVEALDAPPLLEPSFAAESERLRTSATVISRLARAVSEGNAAEIDQLNRYLAEVGKITGATKAERDAVLAYEKRLRAIATARAAAANELRRLDRKLS